MVPGGVDHLGAGGGLQIGGECHDLLACDTDVAGKGHGGRYHVAAFDYSVEFHAHCSCGEGPSLAALARDNGVRLGRTALAAGEEDVSVNIRRAPAGCKLRSGGSPSGGETRCGYVSNVRILLEAALNGARSAADH